MDPHVAVSTFNNPTTSRAMRAEVALGLITWLERGGAVPTESLRADYISELNRHNEREAAGAAYCCNDYIEAATERPCDSCEGEDLDSLEVWNLCTSCNRAYEKSIGR